MYYCMINILLTPQVSLAEFNKEIAVYSNSTYEAQERV